METKIPSSMTIFNKQVIYFAALYVSSLSGHIQGANQQC
jgi:hypothetical protein